MSRRLDMRTQEHDKSWERECGAWVGLARGGRVRLTSAHFTPINQKGQRPETTTSRCGEWVGLALSKHETWTRYNGIPSDLGFLEPFALNVSSGPITRQRRGRLTSPLSSTRRSPSIFIFADSDLRHHKRSGMIEAPYPCDEFEKPQSPGTGAGAFPFGLGRPRQTVYILGRGIYEL